MASGKLLVLFSLAALSAIVQCEYEWDAKPWPKVPRWLRCGMPRCTEKLPENHQAELKKIWENYVEGEECTAQREATKKYIDNLPQDLKELVRPKGHRWWCRPPRFIKKLSAELQQKIEAIWVGYKEGEDCHEQKQATRTVLETISEEEWKELRPRGGWPFGGGRGGGRPFPPPLPPPAPVIETSTVPL